MRRPAALVALVVMLILWAAPIAAAHPLGNFTVNRYAGIVLRPNEVVVHYVLDLAEIPAFQEEPAIDGDDDGVEDDELRLWAGATAGSIAGDLLVTVDERPIALRVRESWATRQPGQGGLSTLRLDATLSAAIAPAFGSLTFEDRNDPGRLGWREITATSTEGVALISPTVPATSVSDRLRFYPDDLLSSPLAVIRMQTGFRAGPGPDEELAVATGSSSPLSDGGPFAAVIAHQGLPLMLLGLAIATAFGAWHALLPGHGKTLMAAAMVGSGARPRQAIVAGTSVALMHTLSVIALGLLVLALERTFRPDAVYPWLGVLSGAVAAAIGVHLLRGRWGAWRHARSHAARDIDLLNDHDHDHGQDHVHRLPPEGFLSRRGIAALAFAGGILPEPSALLVMLAAIQGQRVAYGLGLVLAFSLGLAASLIVVGLGAMRVRRAVEGRASVLARHLVPVLSAAAILGAGLYLVVQGVAST